MKEQEELIEKILNKRNKHEQLGLHKNECLCDCGYCGMFSKDVDYIHEEIFKKFTIPEAILHIFLNNIPIPIYMAKKEIIEMAIESGIRKELTIKIPHAFQKGNDFFFSGDKKCDYFELDETGKYRKLDSKNIMQDEYEVFYVVKTKKYNWNKVLDFLSYLYRETEKDIKNRIITYKLHEQYNSHYFGNSGECDCGLIEKDSFEFKFSGVGSICTPQKIFSCALNMVAHNSIDNFLCDNNAGVEYMKNKIKEELCLQVKRQ